MTTERPKPVKIEGQGTTISGAGETVATEKVGPSIPNVKESIPAGPQEPQISNSKEIRTHDPQTPSISRTAKPKPGVTQGQSTTEVGETRANEPLDQSNSEVDETKANEPLDQSNTEICETKSGDPEDSTPFEGNESEANGSETKDPTPSSISEIGDSGPTDTEVSDPKDTSTPETQKTVKSKSKGRKKSGKKEAKSTDQSTSGKPDSHVDSKKTRKGTPVQLEESIRQFFSKDIDVASLDRRTLIEALIIRHTKEIDPLRKELKDLKSKMTELQTVVDHSRKERDEVNTSVMDLKNTRRVLHELANEKRREFFMLIEKLDDLEKIDHEIEDFQAKLDKMEWEIQTTKITTDDEKAMIKQMKEIYHRMTEANVEAQKKLGIEEKVKQLSVEIGENLAGAQQRHEDLLVKAKESDLHHESYLSKGKQLSEYRIQVRRIERRMKSHKESLEYWKEWVGGKHA